MSSSALEELRRQMAAANGDSGESDSGNESGSESGSGSESESEEEIACRPMFVRKENRITLEIAAAEEAAAEEAAAKKLAEEEMQKIENRKLVAEVIKREDELREVKAAEAMNSDTELLNEPWDEELEYESWKVRELKRLRRDMQEREEIAAERAELQRRRTLTDKERLLEDGEEDVAAAQRAAARESKLALLGEDANRNMMLKAHHKGAFYMDESSIKDEKDVRNKNYSIIPTESERLDRSQLPGIMQTHKFGLKGQTRHGSLRSQDTSSKDSLFYMANTGKYNSRH